MFEFFSRSLKIAGPYKNKLIAGMFFVFIQNFSLLLSFGAIYLGFYWINQNITPQQILIIFSILLASFIFHFLSNWVQNYLLGGVFFHIYRDFRLKVGERLKTAPMGYFSEQSLSKILAGFTNVLKSLENYSQLSFLFLISGLSVCFFLLIGLFGMNVKMGLLALICVIIAWICVYAMFKISRSEILSEHQAIANYTDALVDGIRGIPVLRSFPSASKQTVKEIHSKVYDTSGAIRKIQTHFEMVFVIASRIFATILNASSLLATLFAAYLFTQGEVTLPEALTLSAASFMLFGGLRQLENSTILLIKNPAHLDYLEEVLDIPELPDGPLTQAPADKTIAFQDVSFGYSDDRMILKHLTCTIPQGSKTAIVGPSGSGKTTMVNLMARFYDPQHGSITLGGKDLREYEVDTLLSQLSLVFQDVYLFNDTIKNNIKFAHPSATDEEIMEAARRARCHEFISAMPDGYDTLVGEGGSRLSGGEKQRISIARALLKDAPIILLDEATSSVDPENEHEILSAIDELTQGRTVISIAHRLSTVREADQILVIDDGQLVQQGTHEELIAQPGIYAGFIAARERAANWEITDKAGAPA